jgi:ribosomal protein S18 acetylase RimI-like enzyme
MIDRARRKAKNLTVEVAADNRARALYERLGFIPAGKIRMQHRAS